MSGQDEGLRAVLAAHDDPPGWMCDANDSLRYECNCGALSPPLGRDGVGIGEDARESASDWHRAHLADAITAHLGATLAGLREDVEQAALVPMADHPVWIGSDGQPLDYLPERERLMGDLMRQQADAVLTVVRDALGIESEGDGDE